MVEVLPHERTVWKYGLFGIAKKSFEEFWLFPKNAQAEWGKRERIYNIKGEKLHILTNSNTGINIHTVQELIQGEIS